MRLVTLLFAIMTAGCATAPERTGVPVAQPDGSETQRDWGIICAPIWVDEDGVSDAEITCRPSLPEKRYRTR